MKKIGYARKSIEDHDITMQLDALREAGCKRIYQDEVASNENDFTQFEEALNTLDPGDSLVVWRLDRLGKSIRQLTKLTDILEEKGLHFISLKEGIDTSKPMGELYFSLLRELADMEGSLIREKTLIGLKEAREKGKVGGRPKIDPKTVERIRQLYFGEKRTIQYISDMCGVSVGSVYKYVNLPDKEVEKIMM